MGTSAPDLIIAGTLILNAFALLASRLPQKNVDDISLQAKALNVSVFTQRSLISPPSVWV